MRVAVVRVVGATVVIVVMVVMVATSSAPDAPAFGLVALHNVWELLRPRDGTKW